MQEQIKELVKQAGLNIDGYGYPIWGCLHSEDEKKEFLEKFAELIVGHATECVRDVLRDENSDLSYAAAEQVQNRIKKFFGVEE